MPPFHFPSDAYSLIHELGEGVPAPLRDRFFERVKKLLAADEVLIPARIVEACRKAQIELRIAPPVSEPATKRPAQKQVRGPWRMKA